MSNTSNIIGYIVHIIVSFLVIWLVLSAIVAWLHPRFTTDAGGVNWGTTAWVSVILIIFFLIITWIIYWIFSAWSDSSCEPKQVCYKPACAPETPSCEPQPVMCLEQVKCPPRPKPQPPKQFCATPVFQSAEWGQKATPSAKGIEANGVFFKHVEKDMYADGSMAAGGYRS